MGTTEKARQPYHRQTHPDGWPCEQACQMQSDRDTRLRTALAGRDGKDLMVAMADELDAYAKEEVNDELSWYAMHHPTPFGTYVGVFEEMFERLLWWMRTNNLAGPADGIQDHLRKIAAIAQRLDSRRPWPGQPKQEQGFARHVPMNAELHGLARTLREVAGKAAPDGAGTGDGNGLDQTWQSKAIAARLDHRDWSIDQIAKHVGKSRQTLYANRMVRAALKAHNSQKRTHDKSSVRRGHKQDGTADASVGT